MAAEPQCGRHRNSADIRTLSSHRRGGLTVESRSREHHHRGPENVRRIGLRGRQTRYGAAVASLLLVALHDVDVTNVRLIGVSPKLAQRAALAKEVPALVQRLFEV